MLYRLWGGPLDGLELDLPDGPERRPLWLDVEGSPYRERYDPGEAIDGVRVAVCAALPSTA